MTAGLSFMLGADGRMARVHFDRTPTAQDVAVLIGLLEATRAGIAAHHIDVRVVSGGDAREKNRRMMIEVAARVRDTHPRPSSDLASREFDPFVKPDPAQPIAGNASDLENGGGTL